jgi:hypothetical protein
LVAGIIVDRSGRRGFILRILIALIGKAGDVMVTGHGHLTLMHRTFSDSQGFGFDRALDTRGGQYFQLFFGGNFTFHFTGDDNGAGFDVSQPAAGFADHERTIQITVTFHFTQDNGVAFAPHVPGNFGAFTDAGGKSFDGVQGTAPFALADVNFGFSHGFNLLPD